MRQSKENIKLSIIIVNWNTNQFLKKVLSSIEKYSPKESYEIIVIDNGSNDGSSIMVSSEFPKVKLIREKSNKGFAFAVNIGLNESEAEYYLLLNSDCELCEDIFEKLISVMEINKKIGIVSPTLVYPDGSIQSIGEPLITSWITFKNQILFVKSPLLMKFKKYPKEEYRQVGFVSGACMLIRKDVIRAVGYFREDFFIYGEDVDFCYRANKSGWLVVCCMNLKIIHYKSQSTNQILSQTLSNSIVNNCKLIEEYQGNFHSLLAFAFYSIGISMRVIIALLISNRDSREWFKLWFLLPNLFKQIILK